MLSWLLPTNDQATRRWRPGISWYGREHAGNWEDVLGRSLRANVADEAAEVDRRELSWQRRSKVLNSAGYTTRPRYTAGWKASWKQAALSTIPENTEDAIALPVYDSDCLDARAKGTDQLVSLWRVDSNSAEEALRRRLGNGSNPPFPVIHSFEDPTDHSTFFVTPFLRPMDNPPFEAVDDVLCFTDQVLDALLSIHTSGVAVRSIASSNVMMDGSSMFPDGHHPIKLGLTRDLLAPASYLPRQLCQPPVKYYFTDYSLAGPVVHVPGAPDPFKMDIHDLGNLFREVITSKYANVPFIRTLVLYMTAPEESPSPTASAVVAKWREIRPRAWSLRRWCRLRHRGESLPFHMVFAVLEFIRIWVLARSRSRPRLAFLYYALLSAC